MTRQRALVILGLLATMASAASTRWGDWQATEDSLRAMHPRYRARWLRAHGLEDVPAPTPGALDAMGLRCVGRWSYGPAYDVDCRVTPDDTLIALARGSGVSLVRFNRSAPRELEPLADVNAERIMNQVMLRDSLLYVGTNAGLEIYDIADERNPVRLSWIQTGLAGFDLKDTLAFITWYDSFKVYSIANPVSPYRVGACRDSGATVSVAGSTAFLADWGGLYALDVSDPRNPHRVGSWGSNIWCAQARGSICCVARGDPSGPTMDFVVLDVSAPANIQPLGTASNAGGEDIHLDGPNAFVSGRYMYQTWFQLINIADTLSPQVVGRCTVPGYKHGVWGRTGLDRGLVANELDGLVLIDISSPGNPVVDTMLLGAGSSLDLAVEGSRLYVANGGGGMKVVDVSDPTRPRLLGGYDTCGIVTGECYSVAGNDSFAYVGWFNAPLFRSVDVTDPTRPTLAGTGRSLNYAQDIELRDTFAYCAEDDWFEVINVADPRNPHVVGSCGLQNATTSLFVLDTLAYVGNWPSPIIRLSDPAHPTVVGEFPLPSGGIYVRDTFAYVARTYDSFYVYSVASPVSPRRLSALDLSGGRPYGQYNLSVALVDTVAYIGGWQLKTVSVADPRQPYEIGSRWSPPSYYVPRLTCVEPHLYVACSDGGVCILETLQTGVGELGGCLLPARVLASPSVTRGMVVLDLSSIHLPCELTVYDVLGAEVARQVLRQNRTAQVDLTARSDGVYLLVVRSATENVSLKVTKVWR